MIGAFASMRRSALRPAGRLPSASAGYSLAELMVALVVAGIVLTVAVPNFLRMGRRDVVETAAYDLQRTISLARQKALAKRAQYRLTVNTGARNYYVERKQGGSWILDPPETFDWRSDVNLSLSVGGSPANTDVIIEPQGTVKGQDAPAYFTFTNAHGDTARVSFVRTGRIRVRVS